MIAELQKVPVRVARCHLVLGEPAYPFLLDKLHVPARQAVALGQIADGAPELPF
jgi:hypothetical protein